MISKEGFDKLITEITANTQRRRLIVIDPIGLHARPATVLVNTASKYVEDVAIEFNGRQVNAKSIMGVLSLGVTKDAEFDLWFQGDDNDDITHDIDAMVRILVDNKIVEELDPTEVNIEEEVQATYDYLKRFETEDLVKILAGTIKKVCELDNLDYYEIVDKIRGE